MLKLLLAGACAVLLGAPSALAAPLAPLYLVNFQDPLNLGDDVAGWNNLDHTIPNAVETLVDSNGGPSISIDFVTAGNGFAHPLDQTITLGGTLGTVFSGDFVWLSALDGSITLSGLPSLSGSTWTLTLYSDINVTTVDAQNRTADFDITHDLGTTSARVQQEDGGTAALSFYDFGAGTPLGSGPGQIVNTIVFSGLGADATGNITIDVTNPETSGRMSITGFQLEAVPEPGTFVLVAGGLLGLAARGRRRIR